MRTISLAFTLALGALSGCVDASSTPDNDLSVVDLEKPADMAVAHDLYGVDLALAIGQCRPDPMTDQQSCATMMCPNGTSGVNFNGACTCFYGCTPRTAGQCYCNRFCDPLCTPGDGGCVPNGNGACLPANGPGERCGLDSSNKPYGKNGFCQEGTLCVFQDAGHAYCMYRCNSQSDCPQLTTCVPLNGTPDGGVPTMVCAQNNTGTNGIALGANCNVSDYCVTAAVCSGGTCVAQCDGPASDFPNGAGCTGGTCTALTDPNNMKTAAYVCK